MSGHGAAHGGGHGGGHGHGAKHGHGHDDHADPIKEFYERQEKLQSWIATHEIAHSDVYTSAAKELLRKNGRIDLKKLEDADVRKQFVDKMVELYLKHAKDVHGVEIPKTDDGNFSKRDLLYLMSGHTQETLSEVVNKLKGKFTLGQHKEYTANHVEELTKRHSAYVFEPIKDKKKKGDLLKFMELEHLVGSDDEPEHDKAVGMFQNYLGSEAGQARYKHLYAAKDHGHGHSGGHH